MISGIPLIWDLGTSMSNPCVYVVFWTPVKGLTIDYQNHDLGRLPIISIGLYKAF